MVYNYCTYLDNINIAHTQARKDNTVLVYIKQGNKLLECIVPTLKIKANRGFTDKEASRLIQFCRFNTCSILTRANNRGI